MSVRYGETMTWEEICADPLLATLPHRVETDRWGNIVLSPPSDFEHSQNLSEIIHRLGELLPGGSVLCHCPVQTRGGVKGVDAAWLSRERRGQFPPGILACPTAPEICVEVLSRRGSLDEVREKFALYFDRDARECWACGHAGNISFYNADGRIRLSELCPAFPTQLAHSAV